MSKKIEQRARALEKIAEHILSDGLSQTSLRQLAAAAEVSDRMLLYYFDDKTDVLTAALGTIVANMSAELSAAIPEAPKMSASDLMRAAATLTLGDKFAPYMRLWIEIVAESAHGRAPYQDMAGIIAQGFLAWIEARLDQTRTDDVAGTSAMLLAMIDGLALLKACSDPDAPQKAASQMVALLK